MWQSRAVDADVSCPGTPIIESGHHDRKETTKRINAIEDKTDTYNILSRDNSDLHGNLNAGAGDADGTTRRATADGFEAIR
jgi:hypothetical protein